MPSPRTRLSANYDRRQFGPTHSVNFEYRTARTVWNYVNSQQVSTITPNTGTTFFDLYYALFASIEPDPAKRTQLVNTFLQQNGISPNGAPPGGFATRSTTVVNSQALSFALQGVRSSLSVSGFESDSWSMSPTSQVPGGQHVYQTGLSMNVSHRLTPTSSLNLVGSVLDSRGSQQSEGTRLKTLSLSWSGNPTPHTTVSAMLRHNQFASATAPYRENAAIASVSVRF